MSRARSIWEDLRKGASPDLIAAEQDELLAGMEAAFRALRRLTAASAAFQVRMRFLKALVWTHIILICGLTSSPPSTYLCEAAQASAPPLAARLRGICCACLRRRSRWRRT